MISETILISDLHLSEQNTHLNYLFDLFIEETLSQQSVHKNIDALYILGDFFDAWLGDDIAGSWEQSIAEKLSNIVAVGIPVYFMHGNRDFLLGEAFIKRAHSVLLPDPTVINLYGKRVVLKHGDDLCSEDRKYQRFRYFVRLSWIKRVYLLLPAWWRKKIAARIRNKSRKRGMREIYAKVSLSLVEQLLKNYSAEILIHGHTHCPQIKSLKLRDNVYQHIILSDWNKQGNRLRVTADNRFSLDYFPQ